MLGRNLDDADDRVHARQSPAPVAEAVGETVGTDTDTGRAVLEDFTSRFPAGSAERPRTPVMPSPPPFPSFETRPAVPHQQSGGSA